MGGKKLILPVILIIFTLISDLISAPQAEQPQKMSNVVIYIIEDSRGNYQIGIMDAEGKNKKILTSQGNNWAPEIDSSGSKIAFFSDRTGHGNLWIMDIDGSQQIQLTRDETYMPIDLYTRGQIAWTKESDEVFFIKNGDIWSIDKSGLSLNSVTKTHDIVSFKFSPEKLKLVYAREKTKKNIGYWLMNPDGTQVQQIAQSDIRTAAYDWIDNETLVYFTNNTLTILKVIGFERKNIISITYPAIELTCGSSNDGKEKFIAYVNSTDGSSQDLWMIKDINSKPVKITFEGALNPDSIYGDPNVYYVKDNDIYSVNAFKGGSKKLTHYFKSFYPVAARVKEYGTEERHEQTGGKNDKS